MIEGGTRPNVVAARCGLKVDLRAASVAEFDAAATELERIVRKASVDGTHATLDRVAGHQPMERSPAIARLVGLAQQVAGELGFSVNDAATGGASDANTCAAVGLPVLDGLGPIGGDDHSPDEWLDVTSIGPRTALLAGVITRIGEALQVRGPM